MSALIGRRAGGVVTAPGTASAGRELRCADTKFDCRTARRPWRSNAATAFRNSPRHERQRSLHRIAPLRDSGGGSRLFRPGGPFEERQDRGGVVVEHPCASELAVSYLVETEDG